MSRKTKSRSIKHPAEPQALPALQRAAEHAVELGRRTGTPAYVLDKGRLIDATKSVRRSQKNGINQ